MRPPKLCFTQKFSLHLLFGVVFSVLIFLLLVHDVFGSLNQRDAAEARVALERIGKVYVSTDDILKIASEVDPATKLPYADTLSLLILASKAQRHLESQDYGKLFGESAWFVGKKAVVDSYSFAAPFLMLGELYYSLFKKIAGIPRHFEDQFFKFQINKYLSLREAYDAKSVRDFALDSPLGLADDRAKGYFFSAGLGGSTSTQVNLALRLRDNGLTPEVIFELGENLWDLGRRLSSIDRDRSVKDLVARIKENTRSKGKEDYTASPPNDRYPGGIATGIRAVWNSAQEKIQELWTRAREKIQEVWSKPGDERQEILTKSNRGAQESQESPLQKGSDPRRKARQEIQEVSQKARQEAEEVAREARQQAQEAARKARQQAQEAARKARQQAQETAREARQRAQEAARKARQQAQEAAREARQEAQETARGLRQQADR